MRVSFVWIAVASVCAVAPLHAAATDVMGSVDAANAQLARGDLPGALATLRAAAGAAKKQSEILAANRALGVVAASMGKSALARTAFLRALDVDPNTKLDENAVKPSVIQQFRALRASLTGTLVVTGVADSPVSIDGNAAGLVPMVAQLSIGKHRITITVNGKALAQSVTIFPDRATEIEANETLRAAAPTRHRRVSEGPSKAAVSALARAKALFGNADLAGALALADAAVKADPKWKDARVLRADVHEAAAGKGSTLDALANPGQGRDYTAMAKNLAAAADDLQTAIQINPAAKDREAIIERLGELRARAGAARVVARVTFAEAGKEEAAAKRSRAIEVRAASEIAHARANSAAVVIDVAASAKTAVQLSESRFAREDTIRRAYEAKRGSARGQRVIGWSLFGAGVLAAGGSAAFAYLGNAINPQIKSGGFATGGDLDAALARGALDNTLSYALGIGGGALMIGGLAAVFLAPDPAPPRFTIVPMPHGVSMIVHFP